MNLKKIIEQSNQNANFMENYDKNVALKKKLHYIGAPLAICGFVVALTAFILIGVFGANIKSIASSTGLLISMFVLLVVFSIMFGVGLYVLRQASMLLTHKEEMPVIVETEIADVKSEDESEKQDTEENKQ